MSGVYIVGWPLEVNPEMDEHAAALGLGHWSCIDRFSNGCWLRRDGRFVERSFDRRGYDSELREIDQAVPLVIPQWYTEAARPVTPSEAPLP